MKRIRPSFALSLASAAIAVAIAGAHAAGAGETSSLEAFGRLPTLENVVISPDGTKIAFVRTRSDSRNLVVAPLSKPEILGGARVGDTKLRQVEWIDDDNILATISSTGRPPIGFSGATREWYQLVNLNVKKMKLNPLTFDISPKNTFNVVIGDTAVREVSGNSMLFAPGLCVEETTVPCQFSFTYPERRARLLDESMEPDTD
ncbi:MAG TPA: hypothetical protein VNH39_09995, partial [Steroidobacteraceae bacterium]|nr:hypothetical protein [Steroidobacteraceae bacterium]